VGAGHAHALYVHGHSRVHRLAPEVKVAAAFAFAVAVAVTRREALWAFAVDGVALVAVTRVAGLRARFVAARVAIVAPFVAFALALPFIGGGERVVALGVAVSREGLWGAWNVVAKAGLGATVSVLLAATTEQQAILRGLNRLHLPATLTAVAAFMLRYLQVLAGELGRMRVAMTARGYDPRWLWQVRPIASSAGALFIRSYERGERVHAAMRARGFDGTMPVLERRRASAGEWAAAAAVPAVAVTAAVAALVVG